MQFISTDKKFEVFGQFAIAHSRRWGGRPGCPGALTGTSWRWVWGFGLGMGTFGQITSGRDGGGGDDDRIASWPGSEGV